MREKVKSGMKSGENFRFELIKTVKCVVLALHRVCFFAHMLRRYCDENKSSEWMKSENIINRCALKYEAMIWEKI